MFDKFNQDVYFEALSILFCDSIDDDSWDIFFNKYALCPYDMIYNLILNYYEQKDELESLHYAYNELNSQNEEIIKENKRLNKVIDLLFDFLDLDVDVENSNLNTILGTIYFFSEDNSLIDDLIFLKEVLSYYE